jgi:predicted dehydrogenase
MAGDSGFTSMAGPKAQGTAPEVGIGMLGYAFMGKAHSNAFKTLPYMMYPPVAIPKLVAICGRNEARGRRAARATGTLPTPPTGAR